MGTAMQPKVVVRPRLKARGSRGQKSAKKIAVKMKKLNDAVITTIKKESS
jgi:hypothetical protein